MKKKSAELDLPGNSVKLMNVEHSTVLPDSLWFDANEKRDLRIRLTETSKTFAHSASYILIVRIASWAGYRIPFDITPLNAQLLKTALNATDKEICKLLMHPNFTEIRNNLMGLRLENKRLRKRLRTHMR